MGDADLAPMIYRARRDRKHMLLGMVFTILGLCFGFFAYWLSHHITVPLRKTGYAPATLCVILGLYIVTQSGLRFPRIEVGPEGITVRDVFTKSHAEWKSLGPFEVEPRPFGVYFGNDIVSAEQLGGGRFSVGLRPFDINAHALMMELNKRRAAAASLGVVPSPGIADQFMSS